MWDKLEAIEKRYREMEAEMSRPEIAGDYERVQALAREHASLQEIIGIVSEYRRLQGALAQAREIVSEGGDHELVALAREEIERDEAQVQALEEKLRLALVPKDKFDEKDVIVEIRAAAGGDEASLFAGDLYRIYSRYAERHGWQVEVLDAGPNGTGYADHEFVADLFRRGERVGPVGIAHDLHQPLAVAQIDEDHAAVVPPSMHPAEQVDRLAQVFAVHKTAVLRTHCYTPT